ncbi:hypothetical protein NMY22_g11764 [Coprinellus aureogranulatus]|nr:hypothetical protein NMY22_g11764 [Coprinellus aureogranulatus]
MSPPSSPEPEGYSFKCPCDNPHCDIKEKLQEKADILGISFSTTAFFLNILKNTAGATPITGLKELTGGLLAVVTAIQDKNEVKGGFKHIIVDCLRVTSVVCMHANRRKNYVSPVIHRAIEQLRQCVAFLYIIRSHLMVVLHVTATCRVSRNTPRRKNDRGWILRTIMGSADKATVGEWRQRLTTSWNVFTTELAMDTNYKATKNKQQDATELAEKIVEKIVEKHQTKLVEQFFSTHEDPSPAPPAHQPNSSSPEPYWSERPQGDYQYHQDEPQANGQYWGGESQDEPQSYYTEQQNEYPQHYGQSHGDKNPFRSYTAAHPRPPPPQQYRSDPEYYANDYQPEYPAYPYGGYYGHAYHPPPPHRYNTAPAPVNNIGAVTNANFGVNHGAFHSPSIYTARETDPSMSAGTITQTSYR